MIRSFTASALFFCNAYLWDISSWKLGAAAAVRSSSHTEMQLVGTAVESLAELPPRASIIAIFDEQPNWSLAIVLLPVAWETPVSATQQNSQSTEPWQTVMNCLKPLDCMMVCYIARDYQNSKHFHTWHTSFPSHGVPCFDIFLAFHKEIFHPVSTSKF